MTSLNSNYTFEYSQPEGYKFSHDSVFLARRAYDELINQSFEITTALDLCSGCGIVGLDLLFHLNKNAKIKQFDFIELQTIYQEHFFENQQRLMIKVPELTTQPHFININYSEALKQAEFKEKYDLIVCNPPYFIPSQGKLSNNQFKNRCRFYLDSDFNTLIKFICYSLSDKGQCFLIFHDLKDHKIDLFQSLKQTVGATFSIERLQPIRKCIFVKIKNTIRQSKADEIDN